ncbi:hypothetical protein CCR75_006582 [Bremia lactucae]|uniref:BLOC-2 complex member HPS3 N-terminal domain-containing protein n=1 Tax=Bremia lactucae TaxID=4779 RepID=A0A976FI60_BRELC|nr:hypothetical protein CCR75_006582 [Bremia lactucae]
MESLFVQSLAVGVPADESQTLASASRTTSDGIFAVASGREGLIRVYAASCSALLHEFATIHGHVYTLHYTSFSDSLVTLESDCKGNENDDEDVETFLCVYHDWRERTMVRGYTLPLGRLESPSSNRKADCVAVCSFTGRVLVAMGTVLNIWQCSHGFFEHVMELKVDMAQQHSFLQVEFVAIHGVYVAYASQTEVRVMKLHVRSSNNEETANSTVDRGLDKTTTLEKWSGKHDGGDTVPADSTQCVTISNLDDFDAFVEIPVSCSPYSTVEADTKREQEEQQDFEEQEQLPMVLGRNEAQQEIWNLAGLVKSQDIRTNEAMSYFIKEDDVIVLLQRYLPPNHSIRFLKFLPETIDNRVCVETRGYTRLLVATEQHAFLYYFLSEQVDSTRTKMAKKVLGKGEQMSSRGNHTPINVAKGQERDWFSNGDEIEDDLNGKSESGRVVMHYNLTSLVTSITANSSFLFVATLSGLQVWSIWSPCHYVAASRALKESLVPQPSQPQLLCIHPLPYPVSQLVALDSYVILLPQVASLTSQRPNEIMHLASLSAAEQLPENEFELRRALTGQNDLSQRKILIFQQRPPSLIYSYVHQGLLSTHGIMKPFQIDLLLSLFSLYRYRADVGFDLLRIAVNNDVAGKEVTASISDRKEKLALELDTKLYDQLARKCAADLAEIFMSEPHRNLERAALLFVASNVSSTKVMQRLQIIVGTVDRSEVIQATGKYLEAFVFLPPRSLAAICTPQHFQDKSAVDPKFTRIVLMHYGKYFPEQLSRLIVDSSLTWTLNDIEFALDKLDESASHSVVVETARLVLMMRAIALKTFETELGKLMSGNDRTLKCSHSSLLALVDELLENHVDALTQLAVEHPELLIQEITTSVANEKNSLNVTGRISSSELTDALRTKAPSRYLNILEQIFKNAISRQETVRSAILFCLSTIGEAAMPSAKRIATSESVALVDVDRISVHFVPDQVLVLRFLAFVLQMFSTLEPLSLKEEIQDDEKDLQHAKAALAAEMMRLCIRLCSCLSDSETYDKDRCVETTLCDLFETISLEPVACIMLPSWVQDYVKIHCLPKSSRLRRILENLYNQTLGLLYQNDLICPQQMLTEYENNASEGFEPMQWNLENNLAVIVVLLSLPRASRTEDALKLLAQREDCRNLFLPYGKTFCNTLVEWRYLISICSCLFTKTENDPAHENAVLRSILHHLSSTLTPEDLLQVLPDEGDIALYISTIDVSMRLNIIKENHVMDAVAG